MVKKKKETMPDMFGDDIDPIESALGRKEELEEKKSKKTVSKGISEKHSSSYSTRRKEEKIKVGYYISELRQERLEAAWLRARLDGLPVKSKSAMVEIALDIMFADLEKGEDSEIRKRFADGAPTDIEIWNVKDHNFAAFFRTDEDMNLSYYARTKIEKR
jgi:hypothetical protein